LKIVLAMLVVIFTLIGCQQTTGNQIIATTTSIPTTWITLENQRTEATFLEKVTMPLENCRGSMAVQQSINRSRSTTILLELNVTVGLEGSLLEAIKAKIETNFSIAIEETESQTFDTIVGVEAGKQVTYELEWFETWQVGEVVIDELDLQIPYRVRTGLQPELQTGLPQICPTFETPTLTTTMTDTPNPSQTYTNTPTITHTATQIPPTWTLTPSLVPSATNTLIPSPIPTHIIPTVTATISPIINTGYPCEAQVIDNDSTALNVIRAYASPNAILISPIQPNESVNIIQRRTVSGIIWYEIMYSGGRGWIAIDYLILQPNCP
jgi:hypothetical protein